MESYNSLRIIALKIKLPVTNKVTLTLLTDLQTCNYFYKSFHVLIATVHLVRLKSSKLHSIRNSCLYGVADMSLHWNTHWFGSYPGTPSQRTSNSAPCFTTAFAFSFSFRHLGLHIDKFSLLPDVLLRVSRAKVYFIIVN